MHVVIMGCGRVGSTLAHSLERAGIRSPSSTRTRDAFRRLRRRLPRPQVTGVGFDRDVLSRPASSGPTPSPRSPAATTPTSSRPGWPGRRSASSASSPASTTRSAPRSTSGSASRPSRPCAGPPTGCCASCVAGGHRSRYGATRPARSSIVEVPLHPGWIGAAGREASRRPTRARVGATSSGSGIGMLPTDVDRAAGRRPGASCWSPTTWPTAVDARSPAAPPDGRALNAGRHRRRRATSAAPSPQELSTTATRCMLIERDAGTIRPERVPAAEWLLADACEVASAGGGRPARLRRGGRRHRRRQGQPGRVAAGQDRVRGRPGGRPGQPPRERVAVHRGLGRRRRRVHAAHAGGAGRGGGHASATWSG